MITTASSNNGSFTDHEDNHLEIYTLIWLDTNTDTQVKDDMQQQLRAIINNVKIFHDVAHCERYIEKTSKYDRLIIIVSSQLEREKAHLFNEYPQVAAIYDISKDNESNKQWAYELEKV